LISLGISSFYEDNIIIWMSKSDKILRREDFRAGRWWLMYVSLATWEPEIGRIVVQGYPR
jgi:hypothetical protein